jgi:hypothetical protein
VIVHFSKKPHEIAFGRSKPASNLRQFVQSSMPMQFREGSSIELRHTRANSCRPHRLSTEKSQSRKFSIPREILSRLLPPVLTCRPYIIQTDRTDFHMHVKKGFASELARKSLSKYQPIRLCLWMKWSSDASWRHFLGNGLAARRE